MTAILEQLAPTGRQIEVGKLIDEHLLNREIAERLGITTRTVRAHCDMLRQRLGVATRREIPGALRERGLV